MIILGNQYKFTELEQEYIKSKFNKIIKVAYKDRDTKDVIDEIKDILKDRSHILIVLNTAAPVPSKLIKYLISYELKDVSFISIENFLKQYMHKCYIQKNSADINFLEDIKSYTKWQYFQKRAIDFFLVFWLFLFSWPVMLYSAFRIKKESPDGPVFFRQKRVGKDGREFECIKFRSMRTDEKYFNHYTQEDDPRIFPWGEIMRKTRIDELPQLFNVLKGEMHMIGPRAEWNELVEKYEQQIPYYNERHVVAPGITGWAQVNYPYGRNIEDTLQKLMYDIYYIKNWSITLELKTVIKTIFTVLYKKGS